MQWLFACKLKRSDSVRFQFDLDGTRLDMLMLTSVTILLILVINSAVIYNVLQVALLRENIHFSLLFAWLTLPSPPPNTIRYKQLLGSFMNPFMCEFLIQLKPGLIAII